MADEENPIPIKEISLTPVITNLFKPSADLIGHELRDYLKDKIDALKQKKRIENVAGHLNKVQESIENEQNSSSSKEETLSQLELFQDWVDGAQEIDPDEGIIAKLWQKILLDMTKGHNPNKTIIEKLKKLNADEAQELIRSNRFLNYVFNDKREYYLKSLQDKGIVKQAKWIPFFIGIVIYCIFVAPFNFIYMFPYDSFETPSIISTFLRTPHILSLLVVGIIILILMNTGKFWKLTWIGKDLISRLPEEDKKLNKI